MDQVASEALKGSSLESGISIGASFIFEDGDFGTVGPKGPRPPRFGVFRIDEIVKLGGLRRFAVEASLNGG